jgi:uncharacterized protein YndB with AHSA1/START domain
VSGHTLEIERTFAASRERVFDAWTTPEVMRRWWQAQAGWRTAAAEVDLQVGGEVRVVMYDPEQGVEHGGGGRYTQIERPERLEFTWLWDGETRRTLIAIDFAEVDDGTHVTFTHSDLWDEATVRSHREGWNNVMDRLTDELR